MIINAPTVQSPKAYDLLNLQASQLGARLAAGANATLRGNLGTALQDSGYRYKIHPRETAAGLVDANLSFGFEVGDVRRYKPALDGVTDDTTALTRWASVGGALTFPVAATALITAPVNVPANTSIVGVRGAVIQTATHDIYLMTCNSVSNLYISGLHFKSTSVAVTPIAAQAGLLLDRCDNALVEACEFEGMQFFGIHAPGLTHSVIRHNYFHGALYTGPQTADIDLGSSTSPSRYNTIDGNMCFGGGEFGIAVWDPDTAVIPAFNIICHNHVGGGNTGYGILIYMPTAADTFNQIIGNYVDGVAGGVAGNPDAGAGIYIVGAGAGGTLVSGNVITNCCINTVSATLAPAAIGISGTSAASAPLVVTGNVIRGMTKFHGILLTGVRGGAAVTGNTIIQPASNTTGDALRIANSDNVSVSANTIENLNTTTNQCGIFIAALGQNCSNITVSGNTVLGGFNTQIRTNQTGGFSITGLSLMGNMVTGGGTACVPLTFDTSSVSNVLVSGNTFRANTVTAISQNACQSIRYTCNFVISSGTVALTTAGVNTGSFYDYSNTGTGAGAGISNAGTGFIVEALGTGAPAAGTWAVGDTIRNQNPSAAGVYKWICTTAGTGGGTAVFKTISNT